VETVDVLCLDQFVEARKIDRIDILKVDVEQSELEVFEGAREVLRTMQPLLLLEYRIPDTAPPVTREFAVLEFLESLGYRFYGFDRTTGLPAEAALGHQGGNNLVAC